MLSAQHISDLAVWWADQFSLQGGERATFIAEVESYYTWVNDNFDTSELALGSGFSPTGDFHPSAIADALTTIGRTARQETGQWPVGSVYVSDNLILGNGQVIYDRYAEMSDDFESGDPDVENRGWSWYQENLVAVQGVSSGDLELEPTDGGASGSNWNGSSAGLLCYKEWDGSFEMRARVRVRDLSGSENPPLTGTRVAGLAVHDPTRNSSLNYLQIVAGTVSGVGAQVLVTTTDDSVSTSIQIASPNAELGVDLRIVRQRIRPQTFEFWVRDSTVEALLSSQDHWTLAGIVNRQNTEDPSRPNAVEVPDLMQWGLVVSDSESATDVKMFVEEVFFCRARK